jgi:hypothetical protein
MNLENQFNRIGHLFQNGVEKTRKAPEAWIEQGLKQSKDLAGRVRRQPGVRNALTAEQALVRHVREYPALYLVGAAMVIGALAAKMLLQHRAMRRAVLL